jgi:DNA-directed RNA polymerase sigma subunit (sigma70/sigma32)
MAAWLVPALKAVLPHLGTLVEVATPVFTRKSAEAAGQAQLLQQQIGELQSAATQNAQHVRSLAEELQKTVVALNQAAAVAEARLRRVVALCVAAIGLSSAALLLSLYFAFAR